MLCCAVYPRCTDALKAADPNLQIDSVVLPDGEEHKNMDVLGMVRLRLWGWGGGRGAGGRSKGGEEGE